MLRPGLILVFLALASLAAAQPVVEPPSRDISALLASDKPSEQAWGAYLAGEGFEAQYTPQILRLLDSSRQTPEAPTVIDFALDALAKLEVELPEAVWMPLVTDHLYGVVKTMRHHPVDHQFELLEFLDHAPGELEKQLVFKALRENPPPAFVERILSQWTAEIRLRVVDPPQFGPVRMVATKGDNGEWVVQRYAEPIWGDRIEEVSIQSSGFACQRGVAGYLGGFPPSPGIWFCGSIRWSPEESYGLVLMDLTKLWPPSREVYLTDVVRAEDARAPLQERADALLSQAEEYLDNLNAALIKQGLLAATSTARPRVKFVLEDARTDRSIPLPEITGALPSAGAGNR